MTQSTQPADVETTSGTDVFVARQPIFDRDVKVFAYELLFRAGPENCFAVGTDPDQASSRVISDGVLLMGLGRLTEGKRAFINFTRTLLVSDYGSILPCDDIVVEVLEHVDADADVVAACRRLKAAGYLIALDDFACTERDDDLVPLADFIKVDFQAVSRPADRVALAERFLPLGVQVLAEKVETQEDFEQALAAGYTHFQGYFFSEPVVIKARDIPGFRLNYLRLMRQVNQPELELDELENIIKQELSISYRVLRYINSARFGLRKEVTSIRHALVLVGVKELRKWTSVWALAGLGRDRPQELIVASLVRARFSEMLGPLARLPDRTSELFMLGMFSMIDAIMGRPKEELLGSLPIPADLHAALLGDENDLQRVLDCVVAYERGEWAACSGAAALLGVEDAAIPPCYLEATRWAREIFPA